MARYEIIRNIKKEYYMPNCPLLILSHALTNDKDLDSVLAQIKFQNVSEKIIRAVYIKISCYDIENTWLSDLDEYVYLDLNVLVGQIWGSDKAVYLPNNRTRNIKIFCTKILFNDNTSWELDDEQAFTSINDRQDIKNILIEELYAEFISELDDINLKYKELYTLDNNDGIWGCPCGVYNHVDNEKCWSCGHELEYWESICSEKNLKENLDAKIEQKRLEAIKKAEEDKKLELERQQKEEENKRKAELAKKKMIPIICVAVVAIFVGIIIGIMTGGTPNQNIDNMIIASRNNLEPYISYIGYDTDGKGITITQEWQDNSKKVKFMGIEGTVDFAFTEKSGDVIAIMDWFSNNKASKEEFDKYIMLLNEYFGMEAVEKTYENLSNECYVWSDSDNDSWAIAWYENNTIRIRWYGSFEFKGY